MDLSFLLTQSFWIKTLELILALSILVVFHELSSGNPASTSSGSLMATRWEPWRKTMPVVRTKTRGVPPSMASAGYHWEAIVPSRV